MSHRRELSTGQEMFGVCIGISGRIDASANIKSLSPSAAAMLVSSWMVFGEDHAAATACYAPEESGQLGHEVVLSLIHI